MREPLTLEDYRKAWGKMRLGHVWFHFKEWDFVIMAPPKCGSTAIKQFIWMNELEDKVAYIRHSEAKQLRCKKYVVVRDPIDRFASLWKSKCRDEQHIRDKKVHGMSPHDLMNHIIDGNKDVHWTPQVDLMTGINAELIPIGALCAWWEKKGYGEIRVFNETVGKMPVNEKIHIWICNFYAKDFAMYSQACGMEAQLQSNSSCQNL